MCLSAQDPLVVPGETMNPRYGPKFRCMPDEIHQTLRALGAPVVFVRDWRELPAVLAASTEEQWQRQAEALREWYARLLTHLRLQLVRQVVMRFQHSAL